MNRLIYVVMFIVFVTFMFYLSRLNYLMFHTLVELSSIAVSLALFFIGWNTRDICSNKSFTFLSISFISIAIIDLLHLLTYKGIGIFPGLGVDPPTQLWIASGGLQAASFLLAAFFQNKNAEFNSSVVLILFLSITALLVVSIWPLTIFPSCLIEGSGLTAFKVSSEYVISATLLLSGWLFWKGWNDRNRSVLTLLICAIGVMVASKMAFTLYGDVYGFMNVLGHVLKLISVILIYNALIKTSLQEPHKTLFKDLSDSHEALDQELAQRRIIEDQLRSTNRELDAFVHTVSHDLRSPLTVIIGGVSFIRSDHSQQLPPECLALLKTIQQQGEHMNNLITELMTLACTGSFNSPPAEIKIQAIAEQVVGELSGEILRSDCRVIIDSLPSAKTYSSSIYQVLVNLIGNAIHYGVSNEKPIIVSGEKKGSLVRLFVYDCGPGIPDDLKEKVFELFYRLSNTSREGSTGIGLATVHKLASLLNGKTYVQDTPGGGATFVFEFQESE